MASLASRLADFAAAVRDKLNTMTPRLVPAGGTTGQVLTKASNANYDDVWTDPGSGWTYLRLTAAVTSTSTTAAAVSGLALTPLANADYEIEGKFLVMSAATTTGVKLGLNIPSGLTDSAFSITEALTATTESILYAPGGATAVSNANGGTPTANVSYLATMAGIMRVGSTVSGALAVTLATEVLLSTVTLKPGSFLRYRRIA